MAKANAYGWITAALCYFGWALAAEAAGAQYVYDAGGRLVQVIQDSGNSTKYSYDAAGNIISVANLSANTLSASGFSRANGEVGASTTIYGSGFSMDPACNQVLFNGVSAAVSAASVNSLTVTVPIGATSGIVSVTRCDTGETVSLTNYNVTASSELSVIAPAPYAAGVGDLVSISGGNFAIARAQNLTYFNGSSVPAEVVAASPTSITVKVPASARSGKIKVTTPLGQQVSSGNFGFAPPPFSAARVASAGDLTYGLAQTTTVTTPGNIGVYVFNGEKGHRISANISSSAMGSCIAGFIKIVDSADAVLGSQSLCKVYVGEWTLPNSGAYTALIIPASTATGSVTFSVYDVPEHEPLPIVAGGPAVTLSFGVPGEMADLLFEGQAGQRVSLQISNMALSTLYYNVSILNPDGTSYLLPVTQQSSTPLLGPYVLGATGTYRIRVDSAATGVGSLTLKLFDVPPDPVSTIVAGGASTTVSITAPGQISKTTFSGIAGQRISLATSNKTINSYFNLSIVNPDGSSYTLAPIQQVAGGFFGPYVLPQNGTYTIAVDPVGAGTGGLTLQLYDVPPDPTSPISSDGAATAISITSPGQMANMTFGGVAGQRISIVTSSKTISGNFAISVLNPDGTSYVLAPATQIYAGYLGVYSLAQTGTYRITIDPAGSAVGSLQVRLYEVPDDAAYQASIGGASTVATLSVPGQRAQISFSGSSGGRLKVSLSGSTFSSYYYVTILRPDGTNLLAQAAVLGSKVFGLYSLNMTGTYLVVISPYAGGIGSISVSLTGS